MGVIFHFVACIIAGGVGQKRSNAYNCVEVKKAVDRSKQRERRDPPSSDFGAARDAGFASGASAVAWLWRDRSGLLGYSKSASCGVMSALLEGYHNGTISDPPFMAERLKAHGSFLIFDF